MMSGGEWKGLCVLQFINEYFHTPLNSFVLITMILVLNGTREHFAIMRVLAGIQIYGFLFFFYFWFMDYNIWMYIYFLVVSLRFRFDILFGLVYVDR